MKSKRLRLLLLGTAAGAAVLAGLAVVAFSSGFQTWAARRYIAARPELRTEVGEVSAGLNRVELKHLRYEQGGAVLTVPAVLIDMPVVAAGWDQQVAVSRFIARGWTLDLGKTERAPGFAPDAGHAPLTSAARAFAGIFAQLAAPCDLAIDGVELEGEVILPELRGRVRIALRGGGIGAGREGKFDLTATAALTGAEVQAVTVGGQLAAGMDTPRSFSRITLALDAVARGAAMTGDVKLHADATAARGATGESYAVAVASGGRAIFGVTAEYPRGAEKVSGNWKLDVRDGDLAPFALGKPLPIFSAAGEGALESDVALTRVAVSGRLGVTADRLQTLRAELAPLGELKLTARFDIAGRSGAVGVKSFEAQLDAARPVATLRALQPFEFRVATAELAATDAARDVFGVVLRGLPVAWLQPHLRGLELAGRELCGEFAVTPRHGGLSLRSLSPLALDDLSLGRVGEPWLARASVTLGAAIDYTPQGWQLELNDGVIQTGGATLLALHARIGQLAGRDQPVKAKGRVTAALADWSAQPLARGRFAFAGGEAQVDFAASLAAKTELQATVSTKKLSARTETGLMNLPALGLDLRADVAADGRITFSTPITIERAGRKSDLTATGTIEPEKGKSRGIDAQISGANLVLDDAAVFGAALVGALAETAPNPVGTPPWAGLHGTVALRVDQMAYGESLRVTQFRGKLRLETGMVRLEGLQAGVGNGGRANAKGAITFDAGARQPFAAQFDVTLREFEAAPFLRAAQPDASPLVEGRFDAMGRISAVSPRLSALPGALTVEIQLSSRGGIFRGLPVVTNTAPESPGRIALILASAGSVFGGRSGKKDGAEITSRSEAVSELVRGWHPITYDQVSVTVVCESTGGATLRDFSLIAPELRLSGFGVAARPLGGSPLEATLTMDYTLRARGRAGELLKYLGALETQPDDLGYAACMLPLRVKGTLARPDAREPSGKLSALALDRSGIVDRAAEFFGRRRSGGK